MFWNRLEVESIVVKDAIKLDSNHLLVVYRQEEGQIERRIVQGPVVFVPTAHEWYRPLTVIATQSCVHSVCLLGFMSLYGMVQTQENQVD